MKNGNRLELNRDKPLLTVTVGEFADLLSGILGERRERREGGLTAKGLCELAERLGCGRSKVSDLKRRGVLDGAVISSIGRKTVFDVKTAMRLVSEYQSNNK
ncbi:MAG TPA: hypothetical protein DHU72_07590 [Rikenellaceae bacterium]|nr:hypothetical protein [Rikenellaceae bacterium]